MEEQLTKMNEFVELMEELPELTPNISIENQLKIALAFTDFMEKVRPILINAKMKQKTPEGSSFLFKM